MPLEQSNVFQVPPRELQSQDSSVAGALPTPSTSELASGILFPAAGNRSTGGAGGGRRQGTWEEGGGTSLIPI